MRMTGIVFASLTTMLLATSAMAQPAPSGGMSGGGMNSSGGVGIFSRQDMAMMIVDRNKATQGMTDEQKAAARSEEMTHDRAETPDQRMARKQRYDTEWAQLTPAEQSDAMAKLDAARPAGGAMSGPRPQ
jgi:basic membrane lipoprotein Med (substrate-binding protein (PBP1-ABC) superfamily)